jgi:hypothetical protein
VSNIVLNSHWLCIYFVVATAWSVVYGICAFRIHGVKVVKGFPRPLFFAGFRGWQLVHQLWMNFLGSLAGWLAGWVVINRWLSCPTFMCADEPRLATAVLAIGAFVGMVGLMPKTIVSGVEALKAATEVYFNKLTAQDKPTPPAANDVKR